MVVWFFSIRQYSVLNILFLCSNPPTNRRVLCSFQFFLLDFSSSFLVRCKLRCCVFYWLGAVALQDNFLTKCFRLRKLFLTLFSSITHLLDSYFLSKLFEDNAVLHGHKVCKSVP